MANAGDAIIVMGVIAIPAGLLIAYGANVGGFRDWISRMSAGYNNAPAGTPCFNFCSEGYTAYVNSKGSCACQLNKGATPQKYTPPSSSGGSGGYPSKAGSSGNCSWDTKGGWCWSSTACGGPCKQCVSPYKTTDTTKGCNNVRQYFLNNYKKCSVCVGQQQNAQTCPAGPCGGLTGQTCQACKQAHGLMAKAYSGRKMRISTSYFNF